MPGQRLRDVNQLRQHRALRRRLRYLLQDAAGGPEDRPIVDAEDFVPRVEHMSPCAVGGRSGNPPTRVRVRVPLNGHLEQEGVGEHRHPYPGGLLRRFQFQSRRHVSQHVRSVYDCTG